MFPRPTKAAAVNYVLNYFRDTSARVAILGCDELEENAQSVLFTYCYDDGMTVAHTFECWIDSATGRVYGEW